MFKPFLFIAAILFVSCGKTIIEKRYDTSEIIRNELTDDVVFKLYSGGTVSQSHIITAGNVLELLETTDGPTSPFSNFDSIRVEFKNGSAKTDNNCERFKANQPLYNTCGADSISLFNSEKYKSETTEKSLKWFYSINGADLSEAK